jgi:hypothetical protein
MRLKIAKRRWEIEANTCQMPGQERRETNYKPSFQVERLKKNLVRQLERFAEWFEDFDLGSDTVHGAHSETVRPARSTPKAFGVKRVVFLGCFVRERSHL